MKKTTALIILAAAFLFGIRAYADAEPEIYIDGEKLLCGASPVNIDGRVLVPVRAIFEALGADVTWNGEAKMVRAERDGELVLLTVDENEMPVGVYNADGKAVWADRIYLDVPARLINDRTYVPVRAVSEAFRASVEWDGANNAVIIDSCPASDGTVYYSSDADYQALYIIGANGQGRRKITDRGVSGLELYGGYVYYADRETKLLYRASEISGEENIIDRPVNKIAIEDGWIYYQLCDGEENKGAVYRLDIESGETVRLTEESVRYPQKYRNYIYYNLDGDNDMHALSIDSGEEYSMNLHDDGTKLYPFNCMFFGDHILISDGSKFGNIVRLDLDGSNEKMLTQVNSRITENQYTDGKIVYVRSDDGQDIYCVNIDGGDNHIVVDGSPSWIDVTVLAQYGDMIYYKNTPRDEVYRIRLDGSGNEYICYGESIKLYNDTLITSYNGLFIANPDGSDIHRIYSSAVSSYGVINGRIFLKNKASGSLASVDFDGNVTKITNEAVGEWVMN